MANIVYIATSIDGFIADKDGNLDWLNCVENPTHDDFGFAQFMQTIDAVVMGRTTFETVLSFAGDWPYNKPVFVLSNQLQQLPEHLTNVQLLQGDARAITQQLNAQGFTNLYIDGGKTVQGFLAENLIDELIITRIPILLGQGVPLFISNQHSLQFEHIATSIYLDALVKTHYRRKRS